MRPGKLSERILVRRSETTGPEFDPVVTWSTVVTLWANVELIDAGTRALSSGTEFGFRNVAFTVRYDGDIERTDTIVWDGVAFNIRGIDRDSTRQRHLRIEADSASGNNDAIP